MFEDMYKCETCKIHKKAIEEFGVCMWYMWNVVCGDKSINDCPKYVDVKDNRTKF